MHLASTVQLVHRYSDGPLKVPGDEATVPERLSAKTVGRACGPRVQ